MSSNAPNHGDREHALWSASATDRWLACPMSVDDPDTPLPKDAPEFWRIEAPEDPGNYHTARGTAIHEIADEILTEWARSGYERFVVPGRPVRFEDPKTGETHEISTEEWRAHAMPFVTRVRDIYDVLAAEHGSRVKVFNEVRVDVVGDDCWGSTDACLIAPTEMHVIDLKCGSRIVHADSGQNKTYAAGLAMKHRTMLNKDARVFLHIAQKENMPDGWDCYETNIAELQQHRMAIKRSIDRGRHAKRTCALPTPDNINSYCDWCPKFTHCPAHHNRAVAALDLADAPKQVATLPLEKVCALVDMAPMLRKVLKAAEDRVFELTEAGEKTGFKIVEGRSNRRWKPDADEADIVATAKECAEFAGVDFDPYVRKLASFTEFEKHLGKGCVDDFLEKPPGKPTLAHEGDKRDALDALEVLRD